MSIMCVCVHNVWYIFLFFHCKCMDLGEVKSAFRSEQIGKMMEKVNNQ